jgi:transcriptional regulator with XRE-family HTH domain
VLSKRTSGTLHPFRTRTGLKKGNTQDPVIGQQIKNARLRRDMDPDRVALSLGLVRGDYDRLESGDLRAGPELLVLLAKIFDVPLYDLFGSSRTKNQEAD